MITSLRTARTALGHTAIAIALMTTAASAQELCSLYTVKPGDTLSGIAKAAGVSNGYQGVYASNRNILSNPNSIEVGMKLTIPCPDGSNPTTEAAAEPAAEPVVETTAEPATASADLPPLRFLVSGDYAPFTDQSLPGGGLHVEIVEAAMARGNPDLEYTLTWIDDFEVHLTELLPRGAFDAGYMWFLPDCSKIELLGPDAQMRCTDYIASDPFFEDAVGFYTKAGSPLVNATSYQDLLGLRLCRPDGWFNWDLEAAGLVEPAVTMVNPETQVDCWKALEADEVDVVTFDAIPAEADIVALKISDNVQEIKALASIQTSHVLIPANNPNAEAYMAILNKGLAEIRADGTWFSILTTRMREHEERNASDN
jgi:hypothetical protein